MNSSARLLTASALFAAAGMLIASISLYHHFEKSQSSFCNISETFNCDIVNRSVYSAVLGVPVALIGILGYAGLLALATLRRGKPETPKALFATSLAGLAFALYLTYIEGFVLAAWCLLCLSSLGVILAITVLSGILVAQQPRS